jgi:predicted phage tail protein
LLVKIIAHSTLQKYFSSKEMLVDISKYSDIINYFSAMQPSFMYYTKQILAEGLQETFVILDKNLKELTKDELRMRKAKKNDIIYIVPAIIGGGGKRGGIFALIAAAVLFLFAGPIAGLLVKGLGVAAATASSLVFSTALSLAISGITALFMDMSSEDETERTENKMFSSLTNTIDNGTFLALHYGQVRVAGQLLTGYVKTINHDKGANIKVIDQIGSSNTEAAGLIKGVLVPAINTPG